MPADTFSNTLGFQIMGTGNDNNSWGTNANNLVFQIFEDAIANVLTSTVTGGTLDLSGSAPPAGASQARYAALVFNGVLTGTQIIKVPNLTKIWWVQNNTSGAFTLSIQLSGGNSVVIPQNGGWQQVISTDGAGHIFLSPFNSSQVQMPSTLGASPAYSFAVEPTTGMRNGGTNELRFDIAGIDVLVLSGAAAATPNTANFAAGMSLQVGGAQIVPPGVEIDYAGITAPSGWIFEYGQAVSRPIANGGGVDTYKGVWNAITATVSGNTNGNTSITGLGSDMRGLGLNGALVEGTGIPTSTTITFTGATTATLSAGATGSHAGLTLTILPFGQGDGSTTFNIPDRRGIVLAHRSDMNGVTPSPNPLPTTSTDNGSLDATRLNAGPSTVTSGRTQGWAGSATHVLTNAELPVTSLTPSAPGFVPSGNFGGGTIFQNAPYQATQLTMGIFGGSGESFYVSSGQGTANIQINPSSLTVGFGSGVAHSLLPPTGVTNKIMKL